MSNTSTSKLSGYFLNATAVRALKSMVGADRYPRYVAVMHSREKVKQLVAALDNPAETTYANCTLTRNGNTGVAVPFTALRAELQFVWECIYLFRAEDVPQQMQSQWLTYEVTDFVPPELSEGTHVKLPLDIAPPWEALPPAYVGCMAQPGRLALLQQVLKSEVHLEPATLLVEDRAPQYRAYQAAALGDLVEGARDRLEGGGQPYWYCLYDANLGAHPLLQPYWRRFELCRVGQQEH